MLKKGDWMDIRALVEKGMYQKDVAEQLGVYPRTVRRALQRGGPPPGDRPNARHSKLDPFKSFINELLHQDVRNVMVIVRELQERGYTGGETIVRDYVRPKRPSKESRATVRFEGFPSVYSCPGCT